VMELRGGGQGGETAIPLLSLKIPIFEARR